MNPFLLSYVIAGIVYVYAENKLLKNELPEFSKMNKKDLIFCLAHQFIHYLRVFLIWPSYMLDEVLIYLYAILSEEEE